MADQKENMVDETNGVELKKVTSHSSELAQAPKAKCDSLHSLDSDKGEAKFTKKGDDTAVEIAGTGAAFAGMGKDELMKYANDPFWVRLRWFLFILFWVAWLAMLAGAIAIVVLAPKCPAPEPLDYWQKGVVYSVNLKSFQDSDDNGKGDLKGLMGRLDHFVHLGVNMIALSPIFPSDGSKYGNDITDFMSVHPDYGTVSDFKSLCEAAKAKNLKVILDFVPNHSSKNHNWFVKSAQNDPIYADYYIWRQTAGSSTWKTVFGDAAWTRDAQRGQYYYHKYSDSQPDLNLRNARVRQELNSTFRFWLDQGTAGFRLLSAPYLFEAEDATSPDTADQSMTKHQPETFAYLGEIRSILQEYEDKDGDHRILLVEAEDSEVKDVVRYYGTDKETQLADLAVNPQLIKALPTNFSGQDLLKVVTDYQAAVPEWGAWPNWVLGNADSRRAASRLGAGLVDALAMIQQLLPGTPITYYGEDIGMEDVAINGQQPGSCSMNPLTPDFKCDQARSPYQWDSTRHAGFSNATPWLNVGSNLESVNAKSQMGDSGSHMSVYLTLAALRVKQPAMQYGDVSFPSVNKTNIFSFTRIRKGAPGYLVILNTADVEDVVDLSSEGSLGTEAQIVIRTGNSVTPSSSKVDIKAITVGAQEGLVLTFVPKS